jgi:hypothetical protein
MRLATWAGATSALMAAAQPPPPPPPSHPCWQVWSLGQPTPNFTLEGHEKGVNCVDYFTGGDRWGGRGLGRMRVAGGDAHFASRA